MKLRYLMILGALMLAMPVLSASAEADDIANIAVYDEAAYTEYVESTMAKLDRLYLDFCSACGTDASKAFEAKQEFLVTVRDLMQHMNSRFDALDPKAGAALSPTETMVTVHALTMLVDILAAAEIDELTAHAFIE